MTRRSGLPTAFHHPCTTSLPCATLLLAKKDLLMGTLLTLALIGLISLVALMRARKGVTPMAEPDLELAHKLSSHNQQQIAQSEVCGCFYCLAIFAPSDIEEWVDNDDTPLCPKCGIDSVLGSASGFPINKEFLHKMTVYWFD